MTALDGFEDALRDDLLDQAEGRVADELDRLADEAETNFRRYASANDYDIDHIWEDAVVGAVQRRANSVSARVEWPSLTNLFEYGVGPHIIEGNPLLAFAWAAPPEGTRPPGAPSFVVAESVNWGSVTGGIDEARAIRDAREGVRQSLGDR